jgi:hypothetical protein
MHGLELAINAFLGGLILIAIAAVLVRPGSQTPSVLNSAGTAVGTSLYAAQGIHS